MTCNKDYSIKQSATGIAGIGIANPNLNGTGTIVPVFQAGGSGAVIRSVIIKAIEPTLTGMVRLYIFRAGAGAVRTLFKEVPVPVQPETGSQRLPVPMYTMFETVLESEMTLRPNDIILASTQNTNPFNVIVQGFNWSYPKVLPPDCCNFEQTTANTGTNIISVANPNRKGVGTIETIFTAAPGSGSRIRRITIKALQSTHEGVVRIFISSANLWFLMFEVWIPQTSQSSYDPSFKHVIDMDFYLQHGLSLGASTQNAESFAITVEAENLFYPI